MNHISSVSNQWFKFSVGIHSSAAGEDIIQPWKFDFRDFQASDWRTLNLGFKGPPYQSQSDKLEGSWDTSFLDHIVVEFYATCNTLPFT